jgi:hypothetical protein
VTGRGGVRSGVAGTPAQCRPGSFKLSLGMDHGCSKTHQKRAKLSARVPGSLVGHRWAIIEISPHHNPHFAAHAPATRPGPKNTDIEDSFTSWQCSSPHDQGYISSHGPLPPTPSSRFPVLPSPIPIQPNTAPLSIPNSRAPARPSTTPATARTHTHLPRPPQSNTEPPVVYRHCPFVWVEHPTNRGSLLPPQHIDRPVAR